MRILITGMSGTGKSTVVCELAARGYRAMDLDDPPWSGWVPAEGNPTGANPGHDWAWDEDRVRDLLAAAGTDLVVSGCAANMGRFVPEFDHVVLLSASVDTILTRLATRTTNVYGKRPDEVARVLANRDEVEPRLKKIASHEVDADAPLDTVVDSLVSLLSGRSDP